MKYKKIDIVLEIKSQKVTTFCENDDFQNLCRCKRVFVKLPPPQKKSVFFHHFLWKGYLIQRILE